MTKYTSARELFLDHVPEYKSRTFRPFCVSFGWDPRLPNEMWKISERRCESCLKSYLIPGEFERSRGSLRFGNKKEGHGYSKQRGDFCLVGGAYDAGNLALFYRSIELIGGFHYDLAIMQEIERQMGKLKTVNIMAARAFVFALRGNSNEKLYAKLQAVYASR